MHFFNHRVDLINGETAAQDFELKDVQPDRQNLFQELSTFAEVSSRLSEWNFQNKLFDS